VVHERAVGGYAGGEVHAGSVERRLVVVRHEERAAQAHRGLGVAPVEQAPRIDVPDRIALVEVAIAEEPRRARRPAVAQRDDRDLPSPALVGGEGEAPPIGAEPRLA
jgi:hypothetical protein